MKKFTLGAAILLATMAATAQAETVLDYGRAFFFVRSSDVNRLYIEAGSRLRLDGGGLPSREYLLLSEHPRENTFQDDGHIYDDMISLEQGASFITFMIDQASNSAVISRRYDVPNQPAGYKHQCGASPYTGALHYPPASRDTAELTELTDFPALLGAVDAGMRVVGSVEYTVGSRQVRIDFPVKVININPLTRTETVPDGKQWQIVSDNAPVFIAAGTECESIRNGYFAFGRVGPAVTVSAAYLCDVASPRPSQDYACTQNITASVKLYALP